MIALFDSLINSYTEIYYFNGTVSLEFASTPKVFTRLAIKK